MKGKSFSRFPFKNIIIHTCWQQLGALFGPDENMCLSHLSSQVGSRCHEEVVRIRTQGRETNDHLAKSYVHFSILFFVAGILRSGCNVTPRSCWFISGWKMLMRHLLPADGVEISWTSFFFLLSAARKEAATR